MYAELNTTEKLIVERTKNRRHRFLYKIVNIEHNTVILSKYSNRKYVAATISGTMFPALDRAAAHEMQMKAQGADVDGYYCYLADASAFERAPAFTLNSVS